MIKKINIFILKTILIPVYVLGVGFAKFFKYFSKKDNKANNFWIVPDSLFNKKDLESPF